MQKLRPRLSGARAAPVFLQQSLRRLPALPGIRQHHRLRYRSGHPRSQQIHQRRRRSALDQAALSRHLAGPEAPGTLARHPARRALSPPHRRAAKPRHRGRSRRGLSRRQRLLRLARKKEVQAARSRLPQPLSRLRDCARTAAARGFAPRRAPCAFTANRLPRSARSR